MRLGPVVVALALLSGSRVAHAAEASSELFCQSAPATARPAEPAAVPGPHWRDLEVVLLLGVAVAGGLIHVARRERRTRDGEASSVNWTPYLAGGALGVVFAMSLLAFGRPLGVSAGVQQAARLVENVRGWRESLDPQTAWPLWVLVGVGVGGLTSAFLRGRGQGASASETSGGPAALWTGVTAFGAGALLQIAANIAGGCTSGLALSGGIVLAPAAFIFMAGMFIGGIPAAWVASLAAGRRGRP